MFNRFGIGHLPSIRLFVDGIVTQNIFSRTFTMSNRNKVVSVQDAVSVVRSHDTVCISGFVTQALPETLLKGLEQRYIDNLEPKNLTLMFYGCGDPMGKRGTNHFKQPGMLKKVIASHFGQSPELQPLIIENKIEAYSLPMGSISRMVRAKAAGSPGHITKVGLGTFVDPRKGGGKVNSKTQEDLVELMTIDNQEYLRYKPLPINIAFLKATTADTEGNLTIERESVSADLYVIASAVRASGGTVIAQVDRVAAAGSLNMSEIRVPGALVDCVIVSEPEDRYMGYYADYNPSWSGEIIEDLGNLQPLPFNERKIIGRRGALELNPDDIVNLGIGMPESIAAVTTEEKTFNHITLTTEAGLLGGVGASGLNFGPAINPKARLQISEQFDFYNGGGLDICFLGAGEVDIFGNVNVSKLSESKLTGPGGFIDITQSTKKVVFMGTFKKKGLQVKTNNNGETLEIVNEGKFPMFQKEVRQITFNGKQALKHGQSVLYVTERAVFELCDDGLMLTEIAPGIDLEKDIFDQMEFTPIVSKNLKTMDPRIFKEERMHIEEDFFRFNAAFHQRFHFNPETKTLFIDLSNIIIRDLDTLKLYMKSAKEYLDKLTDCGKNKVAAVSTYEASDIDPEYSEIIKTVLEDVDSHYFTSVKRLCGKVFYRQKIFKDFNFFDNARIWEEFSNSGEKRSLTRAEVRNLINQAYQINLSDADTLVVLNNLNSVEEKDIDGVLERLHRVLGIK